MVEVGTYRPSRPISIGFAPSFTSLADSGFPPFTTGIFSAEFVSVCLDRYRKRLPVRTCRMKEIRRLSSFAHGSSAVKPPLPTNSRRLVFLACF